MYRMKTHTYNRWISIFLVFMMVWLQNAAVYGSGGTMCKVGEYIQFGNYHGEPILWKIIHKDREGNVLLFSDNIVCLKAFDAKGDRTDQRGNKNREDFGSNYWERSNLREWLNSENKTVQYSHQAPDRAHVWEEYNGYEDESGFLYGFTQKEKNVIYEATRKVILPQADTSEMDGGVSIHYFAASIVDNLKSYDASIFKKSNDKVYLLSAKELIEYVYHRGWEYNAKPTKQAVERSTFSHEKFNEDMYWPYWLDTPRANTDHKVSSVFIHGTMHSFDAYAGNVGVRPALYIKSGTGFVGTGSKEDPYRIRETDQNQGTGSVSENGHSSGSNSSSDNTTRDSSYPSQNTTESSSSSGLIRELNEQIESIISDFSMDLEQRAIKINEITKQIAKELKTIQSTEEAEYTMKQIIGTMEKLNEWSNRGDATSFQESVNILVTAASYTFVQIEDGEKSSRLLGEVLTQIEPLLPHIKDVKEIQKQIIYMGTEAVKKTGRLTIDKENMDSYENQATIMIDAHMIQNQIDAAKQAADRIKKNIEAVLGEGIANEVKIVIDIQVPRKDKYILTLQTDLSADVIDSLKNAGIDGINIQMDHIGFMIAPDTFDEMGAGEIVSLTSSFKPSMIDQLPKDKQLIVGMPIMEFKAKIGDTVIDNFQKPIGVSFTMSDLNMDTYTDEQLESMSVYLFDEKNNTWKCVGGIYDPITKEIRVLREHFSIYTVMIPNQLYADLEQHWAQKEIHVMLRKEILDQEEYFVPHKGVTREQFTAWIVRLVEKDIDSQRESTFKDVDSTNPYFTEIMTARRKGIIQGKSDKVFDPKMQITRQEIAKILDNVFKNYDVKISYSKEKSLENIYNDHYEVAEWAYQSVSELSNVGLFTGYPDGTFRPLQDMNRDEAAYLIYKLFYLM